MKLLDKMHKYEMDQMSIVEDMCRHDSIHRRTHRRKDRQTDGRSETNIAPNNFIVQGV